MKTAWLRKDITKGNNTRRRDVKVTGVYELSEPLQGHEYPIYAVMQPYGYAHLEPCVLDGRAACGCMMDGWVEVMNALAGDIRTSAETYAAALLQQLGYELVPQPPPGLLASISSLWEEVFG